MLQDFAQSVKEETASCSIQVLEKWKKTEERLNPSPVEEWFHVWDLLVVSADEGVQVEAGPGEDAEAGSEDIVQHFQVDLQKGYQLLTWKAFQLTMAPE